MLTSALRTPPLRDELFCQLMRHITDNPVTTSRDRAWQLMHLALTVFAPSESLENYVEAFLR